MVFKIIVNIRGLLLIKKVNGDNRLKVVLKYGGFGFLLKWNWKFDMLNLERLYKRYKIRIKLKECDWSRV